MKKFVCAVFVVTGFGFSALASDADYIKACAAHCPGAKTVAEVNACVEKNENKPGFKETACYKEHLEHGGHSVRSSK